MLRDSPDRQSATPAHKTYPDTHLTAFLLVGVFILLGALYAGLNPLWQVPDEIAYFTDLKTVAEVGPIKGISVPKVTNHPPLYFLTLYLPYKWWMDNWGAGLSQVYFLRMLSVLMGGLVVLLAWATAREIFPDEPFTQIGAAAIVVGCPQFVFMSSGTHADAELNLFSALSIYLIARVIKHSLTLLTGAALLATLAAGVWTKDRFIVVLPAVAIAVLYYLYRRFGDGLASRLPGDFRPPVYAGAAVLFGLFLFLLVLFGPAQPYLAQVRFATVIMEDWAKPIEFIRNEPIFNQAMFKTFWGYFGWLSVPMPNDHYRLYYLLIVFSLVGLALRLLGIGAWRALALVAEKLPLDLPKVKHYTPAQLLTLGAFVLTFALALYALAAYQVFGAGAQGRYLHVALVPIAVFLAHGMAQFFVKHEYQVRASALLIIAMMVGQLAALLVTFLPFYY